VIGCWHYQVLQRRYHAPALFCSVDPGDLQRLSPAAALSGLASWHLPVDMDATLLFAAGK
jgi:hypothetical protein